MLDSIQLAGFKSIKEMDLEFSSLNVLIGANGAGKSNLIGFFQLLNFLMTGSLQLYIAENGYADALLHFGAKQTPQMSATLKFSTPAGQNKYHMRLVSAAQDTLIFADEAISFTRSGSDIEAPLVSLGAGHRESKLAVDNIEISGDMKCAYNRKTAEVIKKIMQRWIVYHFHDTSKEARIKKQAYIHDNVYLKDDGGNLAAFLYSMKHNHKPHYERIVKVIQSVAPFFGDFVLEPNALNPNYIMLNWRERGKSTVFGPHQLSDGTLRFMAMITLLLQPRLPEAIIIDEPELGLHPYAIGILAEIMKMVSRDTQIIISTQSVSLVDHFEPKHIIVVDRVKDQSVFRRLTEEELSHWLESYTIGELWEKNVLGGRPAWI